MGCSPVMSPYGGPLILVDKMIGNAYEVVKFVARHMNIIRHVSDNLPMLASLANGGNETLLVLVDGNTIAVPQQTYSVDTSTAPLTVNLPALGSVGEGAWVEIYDAMNNAAVNNVTVQAQAGELITDHGVPAAGTYVIRNSNTITRFTKRNGTWREMQYGA